MFQVKYIKSLIKVMLAFILACITTFILASVFSTQFVIAYHGVDVSLADRFSMTLADLEGMLTKGKAFTPYSNIIAISLAIAFLVASVARLILKPLAKWAFLIAGGATMAITLGLMYKTFQTIPISGARGLFGFLAQVLAGIAGGWVFTKLIRHEIGSSSLSG